MDMTSTGWYHPGITHRREVFTVRKLTDRELYVLEHRPGMTYKAIGLELGISPERVRQIKVEAERKLRVLQRKGTNGSIK